MKPLTKIKIKVINLEIKIFNYIELKMENK